MEHNYNELRKQIRDAFVDDKKSGMFPTVDWVMNYLIAQGRIVPDGYVAVPLDPTYEMIMEISMGCGGSYDQIKTNWPQMIAAAQKWDGKCLTCSREFKSLGIARHRAMHRDRKEVCTIVFNKTGMVITWDYRDKE